MKEISIPETDHVKLMIDGLVEQLSVEGVDKVELIVEQDTQGDILIKTTDQSGRFLSPSMRYTKGVTDAN